MSNWNWCGGKPQIATEEDCKAEWSGGKSGKYFRCNLCGYKFVPGDHWRFVPTNKANVFVCINCDGSNTDVREAWYKMWDDIKKMREGKYWWFFYKRI